MIKTYHKLVWIVRSLVRAWAQAGSLSRHMRVNNLAYRVYGSLLLQRSERRKIQACYLDDIDVGIQSCPFLPTDT